jgi:hypothetical protein
MMKYSQQLSIVPLNVPNWYLKVSSPPSTNDHHLMLPYCKVLPRAIPGVQENQTAKNASRKIDRERVFFSQPRYG